MGEEIFVKAYHQRNVKRIALDVSAFGNLPALQGYLVQLFDVKGPNKLKYRDEEGDWIDLLTDLDLKLALRTRTNDTFHIRIEEPHYAHSLDDSFIEKIKEMKHCCESLLIEHEKLQKKQKSEKENQPHPQAALSQNTKKNGAGFYLDPQMPAMPQPSPGYAYDSQAFFHQYQQPPGMMYYPPPNPQMLASPMLSPNYQPSMPLPPHPHAPNSSSNNNIQDIARPPKN